MFRKHKLAILLIGLIPVLAGFILASSTLAGQPAQETPLIANGWAYEVNADSQDRLWVSDYGAHKIRSLDPLTSLYQDYPVGGGPVDAHSDGAGGLWWANYDTGEVGRLATADGTAQVWKVPGSKGLYGIALDGSGGLWAAEKNNSYFYHLDVAGSTVCTYTLPLNGRTDYLSRDGGALWLGDWSKKQIVRLDIASDTFTRWPLAATARPAGLALGQAGSLWWADTGLKELARLAPSTNQVVHYKQAEVTNPQMLALEGERVWYTDQMKFGVLDPAQAAGQSELITPVDEVKHPSCGSLAQPTPGTFAPVPGQAAWTSKDYTRLVGQDGWIIFQLPPQGSAWGIAVLGDEAWLVDQGRKVLARVPTKTDLLIFLPFVIR